MASSVADEDLFDLPDEDVPPGTHVDLESSMRSSRYGQYPLLLETEEALEFEDMEFISNEVQGASKLSGSGWKKSKAAHKDLYPGLPSKSAHKHASRSVLDEETTLADCLNLEDALRRFDLDKDGKLDEREQAALYRTVQREMLDHLDELHAQRRHHEAHELWARLCSLRREVEAMAKKQDDDARQKQVSLLNQAESKMRRDVVTAQAAHRRRTVEALDELTRDVKAKHAIERELLERSLDAERRERRRRQATAMANHPAGLDTTAKHSKLYLELRDSEAKLARGHEYRDAAILKRRVDKMEGPEVAKGDAAFEARQQRRRDALRAEQVEERRKASARRIERLRHDERVAGAQTAANDCRFAAHRQDMAHAHTMEQIGPGAKPEFSAKGPSALRSKRAHHRTTAAAFRGAQLLSASQRGRASVFDPRDGLTRHPLAPVRGVDFLSTASRDGYFTPSAAPHGPHMPGLTAGHDFTRPMSGTVAFATTAAAAAATTTTLW